MNKDPNSGVKLYIDMLRKKIKIKTTSSKYKAIYTKQIQDFYIRSNIPIPEWINER